MKKVRLIDYLKTLTTEELKKITPNLNITESQNPNNTRKGYIADIIWVFYKEEYDKYKGDTGKIEYLKTLL